MIVVSGKPHVRPCVSIPPDGNEGNEWIASIGDLYAPLTTTPLPLAGAAMLARRRGGNEPAIAAALRAEAPWMAAAIDRIADQAAMQLWAGQPWLALRPMLLVGPAGAGKTHFARRLGSLSGCGPALLSFAGVSGNAELAGNPRGFRHQQSSFPAMTMLRAGGGVRATRAPHGQLRDPSLGLMRLSTVDDGKNAPATGRHKRGMNRWK